MKFTPCSRALATMRPAVASSVAPPNVMVPRQSGETFTPLAPRLRYSMLSFPWNGAVSRVRLRLTLTPNI